MRPLLLLAVLCSACGAGPASPSQPPAATWVLSGQSNADGLRPYLVTAAQGRGIRVTGWSQGGAEIDQWAEGAAGWLALKPALVAGVTAFIWFQGEADAFAAPAYRPKLADLMRRVRVATGNLALPVYVCQLKARNTSTEDGNAEVLAAVNVALADWVRQDPNATLVPTADLAFEGGYHMEQAGYAALATRLVGLVR